MLFMYATGVYLLTIVVLSPHAHSWEGGSFFKVAHESPWDRWWDWAAAWCSVKIILLSLGVLLLVRALGTWLKILDRELVGNAILRLSAAPCLGLALGSYYLVKALL